MEYFCIIITSLLILLCLLAQCCSGQCMFDYTRQPPSNTLNCCNPYQNRSITIVLECVVRYQTTDKFEIHWFKENTTGGVEGFGHSFPNGLRGSMYQYSMYNEFFNQPYHSSFLGKYWCQVINTTADPHQRLMRSNVFTLLAPENYTQPTCANQGEITQTVNNITCADLPVHSEQTTYVFNENSCLVDTTTIALSQSSMMAVGPTIPSEILPSSLVTVATTSSSVIPSEVPITYVSVGVCAVVVLLIVCLSLIVLLIVIHKRRRRKKTQSYSTSNDTDGYNANTAPLQSLEPSAITESEFSDPRTYEMPIVNKEQKQQKKPEVVYSVVNLANKTKKKGNKDGDDETLSPGNSGAPPTLNNPVYMTGCAGGLDHQYSSLNHQVLPATTHDDQCSEQSPQRDDTTTDHSDGQYSQLKIDIYNQPFEDNC